MKSGKVALGIAVGAAVGTALGVLFTPVKGAVARRKIARRGEEYAEDIKGKLNGISEVISEEYDTVKKSAMDLAAKGKKKAASVAGGLHSRR